jgi:hypothetical protein
MQNLAIHLIWEVYCSLHACVLPEFMVKLNTQCNSIKNWDFYGIISAL